MSVAAYLAGLLTPAVICLILFAFAVSSTRTRYRCRCGWDSGWRGALPAWLWSRWHRHLGRCT